MMEANKWNKRRGADRGADLLRECSTAWQLASTPTNSKPLPPTHIPIYTHIIIMTYTVGCRERRRLH
jgi:hypothetical protein